MPGLNEDLIQSILLQLGEDPNREGLKGTPNRVVRSWNEIYAGYGKDVPSIFTVFKDVNNYSQIVICKNIELYSMCEHHMLPFFGKAHVAYLPDKKVIGISKLARLVDIYARRLQIQERIGEQVTDALMKYLEPKAAACIIEATHMCMRMRGVAKQQSTMVTSSIKGSFLDDAAIRAELFQLISLKSDG
jgi:GTP cyclohydrolase I